MLKEMDEFQGDGPLPLALKSMEPRRGKWIPEEEAFTGRVISDFHKGLLDIPPGITLRQYLSLQLNCDPMRITKKFARVQSIGKCSYVPLERTRENLHVIKSAHEEVKHLRKVWHEKLFTQDREFQRKGIRNTKTDSDLQFSTSEELSSLNDLTSGEQKVVNSLKDFLTETDLFTMVSWLRRSNNALRFSSSHQELDFQVKQGERVLEHIKKQIIEYYTQDSGDDGGYEESATSTSSSLDTTEANKRSLISAAKAVTQTMAITTCAALSDTTQASNKRTPSTKSAYVLNNVDGNKPRTDSLTPGDLGDRQGSHLWHQQQSAAQMPRQTMPIPLPHGYMMAMQGFRPQPPPYFFAGGGAVSMGEPFGPPGYYGLNPAEYYVPAYGAPVGPPVSNSFLARTDSGRSVGRKEIIDDNDRSSSSRQKIEDPPNEEDAGRVGAVDGGESGQGAREEKSVRDEESEVSVHQSSRRRQADMVAVPQLNQRMPPAYVYPPHQMLPGDTYPYPLFPGPFYTPAQPGPTPGPPYELFGHSGLRQPKRPREEDMMHMQEDMRALYHSEQYVRDYLYPRWRAQPQPQQHPHSQMQMQLPGGVSGMGNGFFLNGQQQHNPLSPRRHQPSPPPQNKAPTISPLDTGAARESEGVVAVGVRHSPADLKNGSASSSPDAARPLFTESAGSRFSDDSSSSSGSDHESVFASVVKIQINDSKFDASLAQDDASAVLQAVLGLQDLRKCSSED